MRFGDQCDLVASTGHWLSDQYVIFHDQYNKKYDQTIDWSWPVFKFFIDKFPSTLSAEQRKIVHERAESCGLFTQSQGTRYRCVYLHKNNSEILVTTSISYKTATQTLETKTNSPIELLHVDDVIKSKDEKIIEELRAL